MGFPEISTKLSSLGLFTQALSPQEVTGEKCHLPSFLNKEPSPIPRDFGLVWQSKQFLDLPEVVCGSIHEIVMRLKPPVQLPLSSRKEMKSCQPGTRITMLSCPVPFSLPTPRDGVSYLMNDRNSCHRPGVSLPESLSNWFCDLSFTTWQP